MQFDKDIFISYAHMDDEPLKADKSGWISEFHRTLEIKLGCLMGTKPRIWRDPALHGNHIFDKEIVDQFSKVAVMISILTPRYVQSEWCMKEVTEFGDICQQNIGFSINNKGRVFKVIKTPVAIDQHPDIIRNSLGYDFYGIDSNTSRVREYSPFFANTEDAYWDKLNDLASDLCEFLASLKTINAPEAAAASIVPQSNKKVKNIFLSESSYDTKELRDVLKRELQDRGYNILPYGQLSLVAPVLKENVTQAMKDSQLAIHLVGTNYGIIPEGTEKSIVEIQNEVGSSISVSDNLNRLIWVPDNLDSEDSRQKLFLQKLNSGNKEALAGADLITGATIEAFKSIMLDKLTAMEEVRPPVAAPVTVQEDNGSGGYKMIYLICDAQDLDLIEPLRDFLFKNGIEVVLPAFEGEETQIREDHIENLLGCTAAIVFYGNANEIWLRNKMKDFMKISGYEEKYGKREKPFAFKCVYVGPPASDTKKRYNTLEAKVINGMDQFPETELKNLLSKL